MTNLDSILKSRDITLSTKVRLVKAMVFPVVMYGCESWTVKKAGGRRIDAFELWCWLLRVPWTARRSNQSILKETSPGCSLEGRCWSSNSSTLATWCKELTHWKRPWCWEGLRAGGEGDDRGWDCWMASLSRKTWVWVNSGSWWWAGWPGVLWLMGLQRVRHEWRTELNWTEYFWEHWNEALTLQGPERLCVTMSPSFKLLRFSPVATMKTVHMPGYNNSLQSPFWSLSNLSLLSQFFWSTGSVCCNTIMRKCHTLWRLFLGFMKDGGRISNISFPM